MGQNGNVAIFRTKKQTVLRLFDVKVIHFHTRAQYCTAPSMTAFEGVGGVDNSECNATQANGGAWSVESCSRRRGESNGMIEPCKVYQIDSSDNDVKTTGRDAMLQERSESREGRSSDPS